MRIESTPARTARMSKPKIEHVISTVHTWVSMRKVYDKDGWTLEIMFDSEDDRQVTITFSKEDTNRLILFVVEDVVSAVIKEKMK